MLKLNTTQYVGENSDNRSPCSVAEKASHHFPISLDEVLEADGGGHLDGRVCRIVRTQEGQQEDGVSLLQDIILVFCTLTVGTFALGMLRVCSVT
jgi:hypothetical protein